MPAPEFLTGQYSWEWGVAAGATDVQDVIDALVTRLLARGWTHLGGGIYRTPSDAAGRYFRVQPVRISATRLQFITSTSGGTTVCDRAADLRADYTDTQIFIGDKHLVVSMCGAGGAEFIYAAMMDFSPFPQTIANSNGLYMMGSGSRSATGTLGSLDMRYGSTLDNGTMTHTYRCDFGESSGGNGVLCRMPSGTVLFRPLMPKVRTSSINRAWAGRVYMMIVIDADQDTSGEVSLPIAEGVTGIFRRIRGMSGYRDNNLLCRVG